MAVFDITGPDGTKYRISGETAQGAYAALQKHISGKQSVGDTGGFSEAMAQTTAMPGGPGAAAPKAMSTPSGIELPGADTSPASAIAAAMGVPVAGHDPRPSVDKRTPPSPPPTPREQDPIPFGMMGGSSDDQVMWARREIARQMAETGEKPVRPDEAALIAAMSRPEKDDVVPSPTNGKPAIADAVRPKRRPPPLSAFPEVAEAEGADVPLTGQDLLMAAAEASMPQAARDQMARAMGPDAGRTRAQKDDVVEQDYTPTVDAIMAELGNTPSRLSRGFKGNRLLSDELGIGTSQEIIDRTNSIAADLDAVRADIAAKRAAYEAATTPQDRYVLQEEINALVLTERTLARAADDPERMSQIRSSAEGWKKGYEADSVKTQAKIDDLTAAMTKTNPKPGVSEALVSGIASFGDMAPGMAATLVMRNPLPMMAYMGYYSRGSTYADKRAEGVDPKTAATAANLYALAETIPEIAPLHVILKGAKGALSKIVGGAVTEGASEVMTQGLQQLVDIGLLDRQMTWGEAVEEMKKAGAAGSVMGILMGVGGAVADRGKGKDKPTTKPPAQPKGTSPYRPVTPHQPKPDEAPADPLVAAMSPGAPVDRAPPPPPDAPVDVREPPADAHQAPTPSKDATNPGEKMKSPKAAPEGGNFEVMDETETIDGETRLTGRKVRVNLDTGDAEVVDEGTGGSADTTGKPGPVGGAGFQPQASVEDVSGNSASPAADQSAAPKADPKGRRTPQRVFLTHDQTLNIKTDPETFQYKGGTDTEGVSDRLRGATRFDPNRAGQAVLFQRRDGTLVVADGHQRTGLARRSAEAGQEDVGGMAAVIYREADGYTPDDVMIEAALKNIGEDSGTATDAARILRNSKETIADLGLPPNSAIVRTADGLRRLSDQAFGMVANGVASERDGAAVGKNVTDPGLHGDVLALLTKLKPENEAQAAMIARDAASAATTETQDSLFGPEQVQQSLYSERAKVLDHAIKSLGKSIGTFRTLIDRADVITGAGNQLAKKENAARLDDDTRVRQYLTSQANMKGEISDALTEAARLVRSGAPVRVAATGFVRNVQRRMEGGGRQGEGAARGRGETAPPAASRQLDRPEPQSAASPDGDLLAAMTPTEEPGAEGLPQTVIPGAEGSEDQARAADEAKRKAETEAKAQQSKIRRDGQTRVEDEEGNLFGGPKRDLFDEPAKPKAPTTDQIAKETQDKKARRDALLARRAETLAAYRRDGDEAVDLKNGSDDLTGQPDGLDLIDALAAADTLPKKRKAAEAWVLKRGRETGVEHLVTLDFDGVPLSIRRGHKSGVSPEAAVWRAGVDGKVWVSIHNHPLSSGLSGSDYAILAIWPRHTMIVMAHNGDRHEVSATEAFDRADEIVRKDPIAAFEPLSGALQDAVDQSSWAINKRLLDAKQADEIGHDRFVKATRSFFQLVMDELGLIVYADKAKWLKSFEAEGFDFGEFYGQVSGPISDRLRRAGFVLPESGDRGGDRTAGGSATAAPSGTDRAGRKPAQDGRESDQGGRVPARGVSRTAKEKIDDFGQKIIGAAKDRRSAVIEDMGKVPDADVAAEPLAKSWPEPDYLNLLEQGTDQWSVSFIRAVRDMIPRKPTKAWKLRDWGAQVVALRSFAKGILDGSISRAAIEEKLQEPVYARLGRMIMGSIDLYDAVGHDRSLKGILLQSASYSVRNGVRHNPSRTFWEVNQSAAASPLSNMPKVLGEGDTRSEAIADFKRRFLNRPAEEQAKKRSGPRFILYTRRNAGDEKPYIVGVKVGRDHVDVESFKSADEARKALVERSADLQAKFEKMKEFPAERNTTNSPRVGADHRMGANVTPENFAETFGFRGVQFGTYVENDRRQQDLNQAYDALMDLAGVLNIPARALSLNGQLGLAFGARGHGGKRAAAAHYEPGQIVINLTKGSGAGSLAHEWFHALDNYFERYRGSPTRYVTDRSMPLRDNPADLRPELLAAIARVRKAIDGTQLKARSGVIDKMWHKPYWATGIEMHARSFETYVIAKLQDEGASNDYLANIVNGLSWSMQAEAMGHKAPSYPYPVASEIPAIRAAFDDLFRTIEARETENGVELREDNGPAGFEESAYHGSPRGAQTDQGADRPGLKTSKQEPPETSFRRPNQTAEPAEDDLMFDRDGNWKVADDDAPLSRGILKRYMPQLRAELDRLGLGHVGLSLDNSGANWQGMFLPRTIDDMKIIIGASLDPMRTLHHEAIHALRRMGLFSDAEWRALETVAAREWIEKYDIEARYPELTFEQKIEEAIAEAFADHARRKTAPKGSLLVNAFNKISRLMKAFRNVFASAEEKALYAQGKADEAYARAAERIFGRTLSGEVGGRRRTSGEEARMAAQRQAKPAEAVGPEIDAKIKATLANEKLDAPIIGEDGPRFQAARIPSRQSRSHMATAMGGTHTHIPDRRVWEELRRADAPIWDRLREIGGAAADTVDRARVKIQDRFLPVLRAQQAISRSTSVPLGEEYDAYLSETTFSGKVGRHLFEIDEDFTKPIIDLIAETKGDLTADSVGEWLTARHAEERNDRIAKINPAMPDAGSGMKTAEARKILADAAVGPHAARLKRIGDLIDQLRERSLALRVDAGLMTTAEADMWRKQYAHYVPLKGFADTDYSDAMLDATGIGRRFNVRGEESKRALGRESKAFNPLQAAITQAQEVAIRAEKARVGAALYRLARDFPSKALWEVKKIETRRVFNKTTGLVQTQAVDPLSMILQPNEMAVKVDGEEYRIIFHDPRLARAAGSVGADQMNWFVHTMSMIGRWFSLMRTTRNPEFLVTNAFRDMTAAQINIQNFGEADRASLAAAMIKNWPKAFVGVYRGSGNKTNSEWTRYYREFTKAGAKVEFWTMENPESGLKDMDQRIWLASGPRAARIMKRFVSPSAFFSSRDNGVLHFVERTNMAVDNAIRLAAFVEARKRGWTEAQAAALSKNMTVNFNRRGEAGPTINALYVFFNAAVQGSATTVKAIGTSRRVQAITVGLIAAGFLNDLANAWLSEKDDDNVLAYDKIPDFQSQRAIQFMMGRDADDAVSIPMPYGYNIFPYLGQQIGKVVRGVKEPDEALGDVGAALMGAFSPVQGGDLYSFLAPTVIDPVLEMARNVDWLGRPIKPDYENDRRPESQKFFGGASEASKAIAEAANAMTGGTTGMSGAVDVSPEYIDHTLAFVFGSAGSFAGRSVDLLARVAAGETSDLTVNDVPMARVLIKDTYPGLDRDRYFRFRDRVNEAAYAVKTSKTTGEDLPNEVRLWASLAPALKVAEKRRKDGEDIYLKFNRKVTETVGPIGE